MEAAPVFRIAVLLVAIVLLFTGLVILPGLLYKEYSRDEIAITTLGESFEELGASLPVPTVMAMKMAKAPALRFALFALLVFGGIAAELRLKKTPLPYLTGILILLAAVLVNACFFIGIITPFIPL